MTLILNSNIRKEIIAASHTELFYSSNSTTYLFFLALSLIHLV